MKSFATAGLALAGMMALGMSAADAGLSVPSGVVPPHLSMRTAKYFESHPDAWSAQIAKLSRYGTTAAPNATRYLPPVGGTWGTMPGAPGGLGSAHLMHDGTVLVHVGETQSWYKLTPDSAGSYVNGTWTAIASLPSGYAPLYYASQVLPDGRLLIEGGEYNISGNPVWTNLGAIYNANTNVWTSVSPPSGITKIGDASSVLLKSGRFLLGTCCDGPAKDFLFVPSSLGWVTTGAPVSAGYQDEQGYELLPNGKVLTIAVWTNYPAGGATNTELFSPGAGTWTAGASMPYSLPDPAACGTWEIGPAVVRASSVVAFGGHSNYNPQAQTYGCDADVNGNANPDGTDILSLHTGAWSQGPNVPSVCAGGSTACDLADAPAALLPNGKILFGASSGFGDAPTHFFEMDAANAISQVADPLQDSGSQGSYTFQFLVLPTGQILVTDFNHAQVYTPVAGAAAVYVPTISSAPSTVTRGSTYTISGNQLNGRSAGAYYGDDEQSATNFPLVRIVNNSNGQVVYAPTSRFSDFSIKASAPGSFDFRIPRGTSRGAATLYVVANGVPSAGQAITVQ